jgi:hypothetical protein
MAIAIVVGLVAAVIIGYPKLFPRMVFAIGEGKARYERLARLRAALIVTMLLGWFVVPWSRARLSELIGEPKALAEKSNAAR